MASMRTPVVKPRRALFLGIVCLVLLLALLCSAALAAAGPASATPTTTSSASGQPLLSLLAVQQARLIAADGVWGTYFGYSVAIEGDTAVMGANCDTVGGNFSQGSAYVFIRSGSTWSQQAKLTASDGVAGDDFGTSVAISGDSVVVGAPSAKVGVNPGQGAAYVFTRSDTVWTQQAKLTAADGATGDGFGHSVALSGDTVLSGADGDKVGGNDWQGSAYVFTRSGAVWSQEAKLTADDGAHSDRLGTSVALSGDTAVAGAGGATIGANIFQGAAYVFTRSGATWTQQGKLTATMGALGDGLGDSVALSGDTVLVGASGGAVASGQTPGYVCVFTRSGTTWSQQAKLAVTDGQAYSFGQSVAVEGDTAVVGSPDDAVGLNSNQGAAYVFTRSGTKWSRQARLTSSDGSELDWFGCSVALSKGTALAGAYFKTIGDTDRLGAAYVFTLNPSIAAVSPTHAVPAAAVRVSGANFGASQDASTVTFGGTPAVVSCWTDTAVYCSVPVGLAPGEADVVVDTSHGASDPQLFTVDPTVPGQPVVSSVTPPQACCGATVTIVGLGFGASQGVSTVTFGGTVAPVTGWSDTAITCRVPAGLTPGDVDVVVHTAFDSNVAGFTVAARPSISKISPVRGKVGVTVTIVGNRFGTARGTSVVLFGAKAATKYVSWSDTKIRVRVPRITKGRKAVRIVTALGRSNAKYFTRL